MSLAWVLIRNGGCVWALPGPRVAGIKAAARGFAIEVGRREISADEVLATPGHLPITPAGPVLTSIAPPGVTGLTVWRDEPVVVLDPDNPPEVFKVDGSDFPQSEE